MAESPGAEYVVVRTISSDFQVRIGGRNGELVRNFGKRKADAEQFAARKNAGR